MTTWINIHPWASSCLLKADGYKPGSVTDHSLGHGSVSRTVRPGRGIEGNDCALGNLTSTSSSFLLATRQSFSFLFCSVPPSPVLSLPDQL